jgi:hypothetical protein
MRGVRGEWGSTIGDTRQVSRMPTGRAALTHAERPRPPSAGIMAVPLERVLDNRPIEIDQSPMGSASFRR